MKGSRNGCATGECEVLESEVLALLKETALAFFRLQDHRRSAHPVAKGGRRDPAIEARVLRLLDAGVRPTEIARALGIHRSTVFRIGRRST